MISLRSFLPLAFLAATGCQTVVLNDQMLRSSSQMNLPRGAIRIPPRDSLLEAQASIGVSGSSLGEIPIHPIADNNLSWADPSSRSTLGLSPATVDANIGFWYREFLVFRLGVDFGLNGASCAMEAGIRFGGSISVEAFGGTGVASNSMDAAWLNRQTISHEREQSTSIAADHTSSTGIEPFVLAGLHLQTRNRGPFLEFETLQQTLFRSPSTRTSWMFEANSFTGGWTWRFTDGTLVGYARGTRIEEIWIPSAGVQYTVAIPKGALRF